MRNRFYSRHFRPWLNRKSFPKSPVHGLKSSWPFNQENLSILKFSHYKSKNQPNFSSYFVEWIFLKKMSDDNVNKGFIAQYYCIIIQKENKRKYGIYHFPSSTKYQSFTWQIFQINFKEKAKKIDIFNMVW